MQVDVLGCIRSTQVPLHAAFLPVFEAVVNGIHSTQDRFGDQVGKLGTVHVHIRRVAQQSIPGSGKAPLVGITSFAIVDNGVGFSDANLKSFETAYSTAKASRGGKGLGRFSWLVLCRQARIVSTFEHLGSRRQRSFFFRPSPSGIEEFREEPVSTAAELSTTVELQDVNDKYFEALRRGSEVIVERLFEHCFDYLVVGRCPKILVLDERADGTDRIDVNGKLSELSIGEPIDLTIGKNTLRIRHVRQPHKQDRHHEAHLCAHHRVVTSFPLAQVSELGSHPIRATPDGAAEVHHVFVSGEILDASVDTTRTRLDLAEDESLFAQAGGLDMKTLRAALGRHVNEHLAPFLRAEREENFRRVEQHIRKVQPEYQHLLRRKAEQLERVKWSDDATQLDESLYRVQQEWEREVRRQQAEVEKQLSDEKVDPNSVAAELEKVIQEVNEVGRSNLVRYVARRHAVLIFMRRLLAKKALEAHVHRIVFPLRSTTDEVAYDDHNLWLLDDTLAFYDLVASDVPLKDIKLSPADSERRPDILAFKTGDPPFHHIALVEFKRPERADDNPVQQLVEYAVLLRDGGAKGTDGTSLPGIPKSVRIDAYAVATLTPELEARVRTGPGNMQKVEGDWRWHGGVPGENLTIELFDFNVFVNRAEQRNRAFFRKLGLT
ncbi:MAG: ATP-binding protein [Deltaproteobacteria bacterium]|nr:ATP-binding protein [Deltaproteobacteria bacterium]